MAVLTTKSKPTDLAGSIDEDSAVIEAQRGSQEAERALATRQDEARGLVRQLDPNSEASTDHREPLVGAALIRARQRLREVRTAVGLAEADALEAREGVVRAREAAYAARRIRVRAHVAAVRERYYAALSRLAEDEHAELRRACAEGNRLLGRPEFVGLAWPELDDVEAYRSLRGGDL